MFTWKYILNIGSLFCVDKPRDKKTAHAVGSAACSYSYVTIELPMLTCLCGYPGLPPFEHEGPTVPVDFGWP